MACTTISDEALLAALRTHPQLRSRFASMVEIVQAGDGDLEEADAAEDLLFEEVRHLGRELLEGWAERRIAATGREVRLQPGVRRMGKKNSAGTANSAR